MKDERPPPDQICAVISSLQTGNKKAAAILKAQQTDCLNCILQKYKEKLL